MEIQYIDIDDRDLGPIQAVVEIIPGSPGDYYTPPEDNEYDIRCWRSGWSGRDLQSQISTALTIIHGRAVDDIIRQRLREVA